MGLAVEPRARRRDDDPNQGNRHDPEKKEATVRVDIIGLLGRRESSRQRVTGDEKGPVSGYPVRVPQEQEEAR
jgi:hypothetical protein